MKENIMDRVVEGVKERKNMAVSQLQKQYKNTNKFRQEPVSNDQILWIMDNMSPEDMQYAVSQYGEEQVNQRLYEIEQIRRKR